MTRQLLVLIALAAFCVGTQLACTSDPPPSAALREHEQPPSQPAEPLDLEAAIKRGELKRDGPAPEPPSNAPEGLELLVEQIGPALLPYQSVRLRLTLKNSGRHEVAQLRLLEPAILLTQVKAPKDREFRPPSDIEHLRHGYTIRPRRITAIGVITPFSKMVTTEHLTLRPGEVATISGAFGPWRLDDGIFEQPGDYALQLVYLSAAFRLKAKPFSVRVGKPVGDDAEALKLLTGNREHLGAILLALRTPDIGLGGPIIPMLEKLIQRYPKSSYADYARLALTRAGAFKQLKDVETKQFALGPDVLLCLRSGEQDHIARTDTKLRADFYDACEWTEYQADHMELSFKEWLELRKPPAERKKPEPAKP
jgi:hypothetical protein